MTLKVISWACQIAAAVILGQTLFFKFTGAPESQYIFSTLGVEPWGRYASGLVELGAVILLLIPRLAAYGGLIGLGAMAGAVMSHLTILGIEIEGEWNGQLIENDGGLLFGLAIAAFVFSLIVAALNRKQLPFFR